jgi:aminoglycoside phosphotransferase
VSLQCSPEKASSRAGGEKVHGGVLGYDGKLRYTAIAATMSRPDLRRVLGEELWLLTQAANASLVAATPLSDVSACPAFRLQFEGGRVLKGRRLQTLTEALRTEYILQCIDHPAFPKVLARHDCAILTEWIDGTALDRKPLTAQLARECGALQGLLHGVPLPRDNPYEPLRARRSEPALRDRCEQLTRAGLLETDDAQALLDLALQHAPMSCAEGFTHGDFCGENIVLQPAGTLCVIDCDALAVDALDYDLGRTWYRWPMAAALRDAYLSGYESMRSVHDFVTHFAYWAIAATLAGAAFRLRHRPDAIAAPVSRLRQLLHQWRSGRTTGAALLQVSE